MRHKLFILFLLFCFLCPLTEGTSIVINSFNAGELSPLLAARTDVQKYYSGCQTIQNMLVLPQGGVTKRPGTYYIANAKNADKKCRLVSFEYSSEQAYILEFGEQYIRFYMDGGQIKFEGSPVQIGSTSVPYLEAHLFDLYFAQSADILYITHPLYAPRQLVRIAHNSWVLSTISLEEPPFLDTNLTSITLTPNGVTSNITITASDDVFNVKHENSLWRLTTTVDASTVNTEFTTDGDSDVLNVRAGQRVTATSHGVWTGTLRLVYRSPSIGNHWYDLDIRDALDDDNMLYAEEEQEDTAQYKFVMDNQSSGTCTTSLIAYSSLVDGIVKVTEYDSATEVDALVMVDLAKAEATTLWAEAAWSADEGNPSCVTFYEERQVFASTINSPQTIWLSQTDNWDNFKTGADDSDAIIISIASNQVNAIRWLMSERTLFFGTTGGEWVLSASSEAEPLTPTNLSARKQSNWGVANVQPVTIGADFYYLQRGGRKIRRLTYSWSDNRWLSQDVTLLSEHITGNGITQMAFQSEPYPILWCVRNDGALVGLTLEESNQVVGWHYHDLGGEVESIAIIPGTYEDEVWFVIKRTINNNPVRYIEQMQIVDWGTDQKNMFFVDSGLSFDGGDAVTISGISKANPAVVSATAHGLSDGSQIRITDVVGMTELNDNVYSVGTVVNANSFQLRTAADDSNIDSRGFTAYTPGGGGEATVVENSFGSLSHLQNETVSIIGDGGYYGQETVSTSTVTLDDYYNQVHIGLPYTAKIKPMPLSIPSEPGALFAINQRITEVGLRLHETLDCEVGPNWTTMDALAFREVDDLLEVATPLYTGDKVLFFPGGYELEGNICIQSAKPLPLTVLGLRAEFEAFP